MITRECFLEAILDKVPRLIGLLNRNTSSSNYGCFDRDFWHYNIVDFACARKQEATLTLSLIYLINNKKNMYYRSEEILEYIRAALNFWPKIQNKKGCFNEWYPNESSFVATAFSTYAISESMLLIGYLLSEPEKKNVLKALIKAGEWLQNRNEIRVINQQTGAAVALYNLYMLTSNNIFLKASKDKISVLKQKQSSEGWFEEYGGPDIGYLSLSIDYLVKYYLKSNNEEAKEIINCSIDFIKNFIQPNLKVGGEYTSRNTEYLIPHGFEAFSAFTDDARFIACVNRETASDRNSFPNIFDDRYLTYTGYTWLQSYMDANIELDEKTEIIINAHFKQPFTRYFNASGLFVVNDSNMHLIINLKKGGSFRLFDKRGDKLHSDSGILVKSYGKWYTSGWLIEYQHNGINNTMEISGNLVQVPDKVLSPIKNILLRLFQLTFGYSVIVSRYLKEILRNFLITKPKYSKIRYKRTIHLCFSTNKLVEVKNYVYAENDCISAISIGTRDTHIYVPSSRYYVGIREKPFQKFFNPPISQYQNNCCIKSCTESVYEEVSHGYI